ncbi:MAG: hypothetical protein [Podoviridae sp. ctda_1]|nr:MAG: hypothetical protein [Podoviridae sp. ctda_1]
MSIEIDVRRKNCPRVAPTFKDLEIGDLFGLPGEPHFVAMRTNPQETAHGLNAVVLRAVNNHPSKVQAGHHTNMRDDDEVVLVAEASILLDNR